MTILADTVDLVIGVDPHKRTHTAAVVAVATGRHRGTVTACAAPKGSPNSSSSPPVTMGAAAG